MNVCHNTFYAMGTRFDIVLPGVKSVRSKKVFEDILSCVLRLEEKFSYFNPQSDVSIINREAGMYPVRVDQLTLQILFLAKKYHHLTGGAFDICKAALKHGSEMRSTDGFNSVLLNIDDSTIQFLSPYLKIDLGGIGKGFALEKVKEILIKAEIKNALISFGESSVLALGRHPKGDSWKIGLRSIQNPREYVHQFELKNCCLSTSGNFQFNDDGTISEHPHIIDPKTNSLIYGNRTVSVVSKSALEAEIVSTALCVKKENEVEDITNNIKVLDYIFLVSKPANDYLVNCEN